MDEKIKFIIFIVVAFILCLCAFYYYGSREKLSDNGNPADDLGNQFKQAEDNQRELTEGLGDAEKRTESISASIERGQSSIERTTALLDRIEASIDESIRNIKECQRVITEVRQGAEAKE